MARTVLTQAQFYQHLIEDRFTGSEFGANFQLTIDSTLVNWEIRTIRNVTFEEKVVVRNVDVKTGLIFLQCNFKKGIVFHNVSSTGFNPNLNSINGSIIISACKGRFVQFERGCNFERDIKIGKDSKFERVVVQNTRVVSGGLSISDVIVEDQVDVMQSVLEVRINHSKIKGVIRFETVTGDISITHSTVSKFAKFWNVQCPNSFTLNRNTFEDEFNIKASRLKGFYIHGDTFNRKAKLENRDDSDQRIETYLNNIYITEAKFIEGFEFDGMSTDLEELVLPLSPNFSGILRFVGWQIKETKISGFNTDLKLIFKRIDFKRLMFIDFSNSGDIAFERSKADNEIFKTSDDPDSSIIASDSDLGHTTFTEFDFNSFDFLDFTSVSFNGIVATNVNWFSEDKVRIESSELISSQNYNRIRTIYRQIKYSLQSQGNQIDSLEFKAREMRAYRNSLLTADKELQQQKKEKIKLQASKYSVSDRLVMTVNQINDYGLNWWKPLWMIFVITLCFYIFMLPIFSSEITYSPASGMDDVLMTLKEFWHNGDVFWQMFNPARRVSLVYGENQNGWLYFLDFSHRAILGIFIYQIISAFRRLASK